MSCKELFENLVSYSKEKEFVVLELKISRRWINTIEVFQFHHNDTIYTIVKNYENLIDIQKDKILIDLNNELKKLIRKQKIIKLLNG